MHPTVLSDYYKNALLFLVTAGVIVPLFRRLSNVRLKFFRDLAAESIAAKDICDARPQ